MAQWDFITLGEVPEFLKDSMKKMPDDAFDNKPTHENDLNADEGENINSSEVDQRKPIETPLPHSNVPLIDKVNKGTDEKDPKLKYQCNEKVPSKTNNFARNDEKTKNHGNGKVSSQNNAANGYSTKFEEHSKGKMHKKGFLKEVGKLYSDDESEWIKCRDDAEGGLPYSGKFNNGMVSMKLHGEGCLLTSTDKYLARVKIGRIEDLDRATTFKDAKTILENNLEIVELIRDVDFENAEKAKEMFEKCMDELSSNSFEIATNAGDLFQISIILQKSKNDRKNMLEQINQNENISGHLKQIINQYVKVCADFEKRKGLFGKIMNLFRGLRQGWIDILDETLKKGADTHKQKALDMCPPMMKSCFEKILDNNIFFVTSADVKLFSDMNNTLNKDIFQNVLTALAHKYCKTISSIQPTLSTKVLPINNPIYFYLCKSLTDIVNEINTRTEVEFETWYSFEEWKHSAPIQWTSQPPSKMDVCIERELMMLIRMLDHFEPGKSSALQNFDYKFKIFTGISKSNRHEALPSEIQVWLCLLDDTIAHVLGQNRNVDELCNYLLKLYTSCSESETMDSMESLRVITHNTIKYLALAAPFFNSKLNLDREITLNQIKTMQRATSNGHMSSFLDYRDLVEVFAQYWKQRSEFSNEISTKLSGEYFKDHVNGILNILLQCMREALRKNVELAELISFCRAYDELLTDLLDLPFDWYVRLDKGKIHDLIMNRQLVELVNNKWQDSEHKCYRVTQVSNFFSLYLMEDEEVPKHYILETVKNLMQSIYDMMMTNQWKGGILLTKLEQISSASFMIVSVRSCLVYLKEQPDYIDFDKFLVENSKPFATLAEKCISFEEFKKRVLLIKESFWYIRNLNAIDIETALNMFKLNNDKNYNENYLRLAYKKYSEEFEMYMAANETMTAEQKLQQIVTKMKSTMAYKLTPEWSFEFKQNVLPRLLAGMGAVWALHASKDVAITGQFLKPHCIQVLGVLRLLSADNDSQGVKKHLAQILTGQGKSLVLGMTASVLALCGHFVTIMCYSEYLATRDQQDFEDFYDYFEVRSNVEYKTFGKAASDEFNKYSSNAKTHVFKCLGVSLPPVNQQIKSPQNPVLLIDEVDVFFNEQLFGKASILGTMPKIPGLDEIQIEIWRLVTNGEQNVRQSIDTFISNKSSKAIADFNVVMNRSDYFNLLETHGNTIVEKKYTNTTLISNHINEMIKIAQRVHNMPVNDKFISNFRINENGNICYKTAFGIYSESYFCNYYNTFVYFRLKKTNFVPSCSNYGYLVLDLGGTSFAKLPESYPLILGVTGTLTNLGHYEKKVVKEYYKITESSVMPSFFGASNLQFNKNRDVSCYQTTTDWMNAIFSRINTIINDKRAVLVIFDAEESINTFKQQFAGQLDRLNILTVNTNSKEKERLITESGVSKTITLATREMGRGVDYKSSLAVEKYGGVHVIQTFFSLDIKEETQIKGRTARKDNRGSYEMILCYEDLKSQNLQICDFTAEVTYQKLSDARDAFNVENDNSRDDSVQKSNEMHEKTIEFYGKV